MLKNITDKAVLDHLAKVAAQVQDTAPLMVELSGDLHAAVEENFEAQGPGWAPLAKSTIAERQRKGYWPGKILNRHGGAGLVGSITADSDVNTATAGTNKRYAQALNDGAEIHQAARSNLYSSKRKTKGKGKGQFTAGTGTETAGGKGKSSFGERVIKIPGRAFMLLHPQQLQRVMDTATAWLKKTVG